MHEPGEFKAVSQHRGTVVLFAMCICGDDNCSFTLTAPISDAVHNAAA